MALRCFDTGSKPNVVQGKKSATIDRVVDGSPTSSSVTGSRPSTAASASTMATLHPVTERCIDVWQGIRVYPWGSS